MGAERDDEGGEERTSHEGEDHRLPDVGRRELHERDHRARHRSEHGDLLAGEDPTQAVAEGEADHDHRHPAHPTGDGLRVGTGVLHLLEVDDGQVPGGAEPGPEHEHRR